VAAARLLESLDRHFLAGCPSLSTSQLEQHKAAGSCPDCSEPAAVALGRISPRSRAAIARATGGGIRSLELSMKLEDAAADEPWWCDCPDRKGPHVHMPNWGAERQYGMVITALVDLETGREIPGSRK
jgi:hypothetical protein